MITAKQVTVVKVTDPDSGGEVEIAIYKLSTGGMCGIDVSFFDTEEPVYCPYDKARVIKFED